MKISRSGLNISLTGFKRLKLYNEYMVVGIPRFMMFDQDGRIITINAMRPSNSKIVPFIEEQLAKPRKVQGLSGMKKIKLK